YELACNSRGARFIRASAIDDCLSTLSALLGVLNEQLEGDRAGNHAIAHPAFAGACIHDDQGEPGFAAMGELLHGDATHAKLLEKLVSAPELECHEGSQQHQNQQAADAPKPRELSEHILHSVMEDRSDEDSGGRPQGGPDEVIRHETRQWC